MEPEEEADNDKEFHKCRKVNGSPRVTLVNVLVRLIFRFWLLTSAHFAFSSCICQIERINGFDDGFDYYV